MSSWDWLVLCGEANMAPWGGIVALHHCGGLGHGDTAAPDTEIDRRVDIGIVELHQHVGAGDAELRRAEGDEGRDVEAAHPNDAEILDAGGETKRPRDRKSTRLNSSH